MPFEAKFLMPLARQPQAALRAFAAAGRRGITVLEDLDGCLPTEQLAFTLAGSGQRPVWLRLGPEDRDPAAFILSAIAAARRCQPDIGQATLLLMRARPGPLHGWPALLAQLGRELSECLAGQRALVLEDPHNTWPRSATFSLIRTHLLPVLARDAPCVLITGGGWPAGELRGCDRHGAPELRIPDAAAARLLGECAPHLGARQRDRALALAGGREAVLAGLQAVGMVAGEEDVVRLLRHARSWQQLLARVTRTLLRDTDEEGRRALGLALRTGYAHPAVTGVAAGLGPVPPGPWLQALEEGWARVRQCWRRPLAAWLGGQGAAGRQALHRVADGLMRRGADEQAIAWYLELGDHECAARAIAAITDRLMDAGEWVTLGGWLGQLPGTALSAYPELLYCQADIAASLGNRGLAARRFSDAAARFAERHDAAGACRSLLAASAAATGAGDLAEALARACAAGSLADAASLAGFQMWASWQQGRVSLLRGDTDTALVSFTRAAAVVPAGAGAEADVVDEAGQLSTQLGELRKQQASHRDAVAALSFTEHRLHSELLAHVSTPGQRAGSLLRPSWSETPAPLKSYGSYPAPPAKPAGPVTRLAGLRRTALAGRLPGGRHAAGRAHAGRLAISHGGKPHAIVPGQVAGGGSAVPGSRPAGPAQRRAARPGPNVAVHLLGHFHVTVNDVPVDGWSSARSRSLFGYLLTHRQPWPQREVLMEVFWPGSPPRVSRNRLNVAFHSLRRILRTVTDEPVIVYTGGVYRIHPDVHLWLDVQEFGDSVGRGRRLEESGDPGGAAEAYEFAAGLYFGDFLADDPYEEWASRTREQLRFTCLDTLQKLSGLRFSAGQYAACVNLCHRIIEQDACREDAHRLLMRCYSRQGQPHLALMQYRACARALADELGIEPEPATSELKERIQRHEPA